MKKHPLHYFKATPYNVPNFTLIEMEKPPTIVEINFGPEALTAYLFLGNQLNPTLKPHINRKSDPKIKASTKINGFETDSDSFKTMPVSITEPL